MQAAINVWTDEHPFLVVSFHMSWSFPTSTYASGGVFFLTKAVECPVRRWGPYTCQCAGEKGNSQDCKAIMKTNTRSRSHHTHGALLLLVFWLYFLQLLASNQKWLTRKMWMCMYQASIFMALGSVLEQVWWDRSLDVSICTASQLVHWKTKNFIFLLVQINIICNNKCIIKQWS